MPLGCVLYSRALPQIVMSHSAVVGLATQLELEWPPVLDGVLGGLGTAAAPVGGLISMECTLKDVLPATSVVFSSTLLVIAGAVMILMALIVAGLLLRIREEGFVRGCTSQKFRRFVIISVVVLLCT